MKTNLQILLSSCIALLALTACHSTPKDLAFASREEQDVQLFHQESRTIKLNQPNQAGMTWNIDDTEVATISPEGVIMGGLLGKTSFHVTLNGKTLTGSVTVKPKYSSYIEPLFGEKISRKMVEAYEKEQKRTFYKEMLFGADQQLLIYKSEGTPVKRITYIYLPAKDQILQAMVELQSKDVYNEIHIAEFLSERYHFVKKDTEGMKDINNNPSSIYQRGKVVLKDRQVGGAPVIAYQFAEEKAN